MKIPIQTEDVAYEAEFFYHLTPTVFNPHKSIVSWNWIPKGWKPRAREAWEQYDDLVDSIIREVV